MPRRLRRPLARLGAAPLLLVVSACTTVEGNPVKEAFNGAGIGPKQQAAPDFVANSRPASVEYMPVGVSAPKPTVRPRSAERVKDLQAELDSARGRNAAQGAQAQRAGAAVKPAPAPPPPPAE